MSQVQDRRSAPVGVSPFANHLPVKIRFGDGVAAELGGIVAAEGARRALVVMDAGLEEQSAAVAASVATLADAGVEAVRYPKAPGEPSTVTVDEAAQALGASGAQAVVAIGGGSVIDTAKAARLCVGRGGTFAEFLAGDRQYPSPDLPLVALPTTAGTGSEVSGGAVITDSATKRKSGIASARLRPQHALVDPVLTYSAPAALTAYTGIDALAQAVAGMIARTRTPIGDAIALESVRLIGRALMPACRDGSDAAARSEMACGSLMAGLTMNISDCTAEHSLAQAVASVASAPHGLTIGVVFAEVLERERRHVPDTLERVADALGVPPDGAQDGSRAVRGIRELLAELEFPVLADLGVQESQLDRIAELALQDFFITQAPVPWSFEEARAALRSALAEGRRGTEQLS